MNFDEWNIGTILGHTLANTGFLLSILTIHEMELLDQIKCKHYLNRSWLTDQVFAKYEGFSLIEFTQSETFAEFHKV